MKSRLAALVFVAGACAATDSGATLTYSTTFNDPSAQAVPYYGNILSALDASMSTWGSYLRGSADYSIEVEITNTNAIARAGSFSVGLLGYNGSYFVYELGAAYELRTGIDPNGPSLDIHILLNPSYLANDLWFDPDPMSRTAAVPANRIDAVTVFLHEIGHVFAMSGWGDLTTGALPSNYASTWDVRTFFDGQTLFFNGPAAQLVYGGPVPVMSGNNFHVGNAGGPGADLVPDLMYGFASRGTRKYISTLDLAIFEDVGVPLVVSVVPEPTTLGLVASGLTLIGVAARRRRGLQVAHRAAAPRRLQGRQ